MIVVFVCFLFNEIVFLEVAGRRRGNVKESAYHLLYRMCCRISSSSLSFSIGYVIP